MDTKNGIKNFRERLRKSQSVLADDLGMEQQTLSNWEKGSVPKNFAAIRKFLDMGITVEELFGIEYNEKHNLIEAQPEPKPKTEPEPAQATTEDLLKELGAKMNKMENKVEELNEELNNIKKQPSRQAVPPAVANLA